MLAETILHFFTHQTFLSKELHVSVHFLLQRGAIYRVYQINLNQKPPLYRLKNLNNEILKGFYDASQLLEVPKPRANQTFEISKVIAQRTTNFGVRQVSLTTFFQIFNG